MQAWYQGHWTPHYRESHARYREKLRQFVEQHLMPFAGEWDEAGGFPRDVLRKAYAHGVNGLWPKAFGGNGPEDADVFHHIIFNDEVCRVGSGGMMAAIFTPNAIALPPVIHHGNEAMKQRVVPRVVRGEGARMSVCWTCVYVYAAACVTLLSLSLSLSLSFFRFHACSGHLFGRDGAMGRQ